ncbi:hypothetical protein EQG41_19740 [Billgrantia azerbaijanica]|nr:hypothetical protein EQG41_19740 [Halomonas azerbaijanica]
MTAITIAHTIADLLNNDGQQFDTDDGRNLVELCEERNATVEYAVRAYADDEDQTQYWEAGFSGDHFAGDPVRYAFSDGSAIVEAGDGWDIEGAEPFSWAM